MSKELNALDFIQDESKYSNDIKYRDAIDLIRSALIEKEDIDNANPSETMECLDKLSNLDIVIGKTKKYDISTTVGNYFKCEIIAIKQSLIKAQEREKVINTIKNKNVDEYNDLKFLEKEKLDEEEFDLLKRYVNER